MKRPISQSLAEWEERKRREPPLPPGQLRLFTPPHRERINPMNDKQRRHRVRELAEKAIKAYQEKRIGDAHQAHDEAMAAMKEAKDLPVYLKTRLADYRKQNPVEMAGDREAVVA